MQKLNETSVQYLKGVGPSRKKILENLGVETIEDLLYLFPRRYEDRRELTKIAQTQPGQVHTICGKVLGLKARRSYFSKKHVSEIVIDDNSGRMTAVWFNQPYLEKYFRDDSQVILHGKVAVYNNRLQMISPEYEVVTPEDEADGLNMKRIVPIYPLTRGITQRYLRKMIHACLAGHDKDLLDELPVPLRNKHRLMNLKRSINNIHFPDTFENQEEALRRISFEEFYFFQISILLRRMKMRQKAGFAHKISEADAAKFISMFPFDLTSAQKRAIDAIRQDMSGSNPMLRLLQGDVGSGKTVVAFFGAVVSSLNGYQSAIIAPTEILARQHAEKIKGFLSNGPFKNIRSALLTGSMMQAEREEILKLLKNGKIDLLIGTHALLSEYVCFKNLSFVVIDEQHKFGVRQRALLSRKNYANSAKGKNPDVLIMTATPIPRTLHMTLYGDLDLSIIDELPPGRGKVKTSFYEEDKAADAYSFVRSKLKEGRQAYVIYPLIEESEKLDLKAAEEMFKQFQKEEFKDFKIGLVHGGMKRDMMAKTMEAFKKGELDLLVATTVLEVGIDVANATVMVIEHAERFGLSQLHQLRGRIGRSQHEGFCLLIGDIENNEDGTARIKAIVSSTDGFVIAQKDLEIRGAGQYFGRHQHGLNELKVANPLTQIDVLELTRKEATELVNQDPELKTKDHQPIKAVIEKRYPTYLVDVESG